MSMIRLADVDLHYEKYGNKGPKVILMHGWGQNTEMMAFIGEYLKSRFIVYNIDLPGFGQSSEPPMVWGVDDYSGLIRAFCLRKKIEEPIFIAHSFGCRVALDYASRYPVRQMVLTGAAGIRDRHGPMWYLRTYAYKLGKKILGLKVFEKYRSSLIGRAGSEDYRNSTGVMRGTFVKVVNEDLTPILKDIPCETLLVFGENDEATPVRKGRMMEKLMPEATLVIFENDDHYAYFHQAVRFCRVLDAFLEV